jgi:conserved oligomeric Golgi complex subunit 6
VHAQELQSLRGDSTATMEQIRTANQSALEDLKAQHASTLESESNRLEKQINALKLDLKATQDDLAKAKAALESARGEIENLTGQRDEALAAAASVPQTAPEDVEEMARLSKELSNTKDDLAAVTDMLDLTKASLTEMSHNHTKELEEAAKARADEVMKLRSARDEDVTSLATQKSELLVKLSDLEGELATLKVTISSETVAPKSNSNGVAHLATGVTKEELQRMHEAHNLKMYDLQAEHEKVMKALKLELEASDSRVEEGRQEVERKMMEIQYLEQDQEESQEQITRYVGFFRFKSFIGAAIALAVIYGFI